MIRFTRTAKKQTNKQTEERKQNKTSMCNDLKCANMLKKKKKKLNVLNARIFSDILTDFVIRVLDNYPYQVLTSHITSHNSGLVFTVLHTRSSHTTRFMYHFYVIFSFRLATLHDAWITLQFFCFLRSFFPPFGAWLLFSLLHFCLVFLYWIFDLRFYFIFFVHLFFIAMRLMIFHGLQQI